MPTNRPANIEDLRALLPRLGEMLDYLAQFDELRSWLNETTARLEAWEERLVDRELELDRRERELLLELPAMHPGAMAMSLDVDIQ